MCPYLQKLKACGAFQPSSAGSSICLDLDKDAPSSVASRAGRESDLCALKHLMAGEGQSGWVG